MPSWLFSLPDLADVALLLLRLVIGGMFAMSGYFKLTDPARKQKMAESLREAGVPTALTPLMSALELIGGLLVVLGLLTALGILILIAISVGALLTTAIPKPKAPASTNSKTSYTRLKRSSRPACWSFWPLAPVAGASTLPCVSAPIPALIRPDSGFACLENPSHLVISGKKFQYHGPVTAAWR